MRRLKVHLLPAQVAPEELAGGTCAVIDVLRATTTIACALFSGARAVIPCYSILEARKCGSRFPEDQVVLGGERGGLRILFFDLGNSPAEYTAEAVGGRTVVLTTTNGTGALRHAAPAAEVVAAAFVNLTAVCTTLSDRAQVDLLCAGTNNRVSEDDVLAAGAIVERLTSVAPWQLNDEAIAARDMWRQVTDNVRGDGLKQALVEALRASPGGRNLISIGFDADIELAAEIDRAPIVPRYDVTRRQLEARSAL